MQNLADILDTAIEFERTARDFYTGLAPKVSKRIRYLVVELAVEEQRHLDLFAELRDRPGLAEQLRIMVQTPPGDSRFSDCVHLPELGDNPDDQAVLQYALGREHAAMEQYGSLAQGTPAGPIRDLFTFLAAEEAEHKLQLEELYYEIVHGTGV